MSDPPAVFCLQMRDMLSGLSSSLWCLGNKAVMQLCRFSRVVSGASKVDNIH